MDPFTVNRSLSRESEYGTAADVAVALGDLTGLRSSCVAAMGLMMSWLSKGRELFGREQSREYLLMPGSVEGNHSTSSNGLCSQCCLSRDC